MSLACTNFPKYPVSVTASMPGPFPDSLETPTLAPLEGCAGWWELMKFPCKKWPESHVLSASRWTLESKGPTWAPSASCRKTETIPGNKPKQTPNSPGSISPLVSKRDLGALKWMGRNSVFLTKQNQWPINKTH